MYVSTNTTLNKKNQFVTKSPGANAHHPTLAVELRYDIFSDFGTKVNIELAYATRP